MSHPTSTHPRYASSSLNGLSSRRTEPAHLDYDDDDDDTQDLVLPAESMSSGSDALEERVQSTQNRLARLRAEAEALEREKEQFEILSRRQRDFMNGRVEMTEKLSRAVTQIDRETYEAQKRAEQLLVIKDSFQHHLEVIDSLNPEEWDSDDLADELQRSLELIGSAREEYVKGSSKVASLGNVAASPASAAQVTTMQSKGEVDAAPSPMMAGKMNKDTFRFWVLCGLGFTLPMATISFVLFLAWLIAR